MTKATYRLNSALNEDQLQRIVDDSLTLLAEYGILCEHAGIQDRLKHTAGVTVQNQRLRFHRDLVREHIQRLRKMGPPPNEAERNSGRIKLTGVGPWTCLNVVDLDEGGIRPATRGDLTAATRLLEGLGIEPRNHCAPVFPSDVPARLACLTMCRDGWRYSRTSGGVASSVTEIKYLYDLAQIADAAMPFLLVEFGISPLKFNTASLDLVYQLLDHEAFAAVSVDPASITTLGGTGPIQPLALLAQSLAEAVGGSLFVHLLTRGRRTPVPGGLTAIGTDLRYGTVTFSSPEAALLLELGREVSACLLGWTDPGGAIRSLSKGSDAQAGIEKTLTTLAGALHGARSFIDVGMLSIDEIFSFAQAVIDQETIACVERFLNGLDLSGPVDTLALLREAEEDGNFLAHPTTLEHYRDVYWTPRLLERRMLGNWQAAGSPSLVDKAREVARAVIAKQPPRLDAAAEAALEKLYQEACRKIQQVG